MAEMFVATALTLPDLERCDSQGPVTEESVCGCGSPRGMRWTCTCSAPRSDKPHCSKEACFLVDDKLEACFCGDAVFGTASGLGFRRLRLHLFL